jgi:beta-glucanase (GH16 family)
MKFASALIAVVGVAEATRYKSGAVTGYEKFTYGKFITRMKAPNKKGTVSSFFTYWNGPNFYPGGWNELDVEIVPSVSQNPFSMNIIYGDGYQKHESHDYMRGFDPKDDWHIYEMAWTPDYIAWSVDNKEVRRVKATDASVQSMTKGQSVMMNFWTPTFESWGKGFKAEDMPWYVLYDYVETFTYNAETSGFDFHWRDDFTDFDPQRWHKSDNTTFDANSTTFRASQSYIDGGHLVLKMEPDVAEELHYGQHYMPTTVVPVETEPTYEHMPKAKKPEKSDEHYDILEEQHRSHFDHEHQ